MTYAKIHTTGRYLPSKVVSNDDLAGTLDTSHDWIVERTGIERRHIAQAHETTSYMASQAAKNCLIKSGLDVNDIDMILVATCTPDHFFPSMACFVQKALGCSRYIPSMDISAACSGFIYAMDVANQYIRSGTARHVMVVGSETMSRAVDWTDRSSCIFFGDGAAAAIMSVQVISRALLMAVNCKASHDTDGLLRYPN